MCEIEIEKLANDLEVEEGGVLRKIVCPEGETRQCGEPIAVIASADEDISALLDGVEDGTSATGTLEKSDAPKPDSEQAGSTKALGTGKGMEITPKALKLAQELGVDYSGIAGTGIHGAITRADIRNHAEAAGVSPLAAASAAAGSGWAPMRGSRKVIADVMMESLSSTAQATIAMDADITELVKEYKNQKGAFATENVKLSYTALIIKAMASALTGHPGIRTVADGKGNMKTSGEINIGIGVDANYGLIVPVMKNCDQKTVKQICSELVRLSDRAKAGTLSPEETKGGTVTLSNLGMFGVRYSTPVLNRGESAIVGAGTITEEPAVIDGGLFVRNILALSMTFDHRVIDGAPAARYLRDVVSSLQNPKGLFV